MRLRNHHDLWSGAMFIGFGVLFMLLSQQYQVGTAAKMGPGYFPTMLGALLTLLGVAIAATAFSKNTHEARISPIGWREIIVVLFSVMLFAFCLPRLGIVVSIVILIVTASLASHEFRLRTALISSLVLLVLSYLVFVRGLDLQFPILPKFLSAWLEANHPEILRLLGGRV